VYINPADLCAFTIVFTLLFAAGVYTAEYIIERHICFVALAASHVILALAELVRHALGN